MTRKPQWFPSFTCTQVNPKSCLHIFTTCVLSSITRRILVRSGKFLSTSSLLVMTSGRKSLDSRIISWCGRKTFFNNQLEVSFRQIADRPEIKTISLPAACNALTIWMMGKFGSSSPTLSHSYGPRLPRIATVPSTSTKTIFELTSNNLLNEYQFLVTS